MDGNGQNQFEQRQDSKEKVLPFKSVSILLLLFGFYFLVFSMAQFVINSYTNEYILRVSCKGNVCSTETASLRFADKQHVYVYLKTIGLQKDINYVNSYSLQQAKGEYQSLGDKISCYKGYTNLELLKFYNVFGQFLNPESIAFPCGIRSFFFPRGNISLQSPQTNLYLHQQNQINRYARHVNFKNHNLSLQWLNVQQPSFINFMTDLSSYDTSKYFGKFEQVISGPYRINFIMYQPSFVDYYDIVLTDSMTIGGNNGLLCVISLVKSFICFICATISYFVNKKLVNKIYINDENKDENNDENKP